MLLLNGTKSPAHCGNPAGHSPGHLPGRNRGPGIETAAPGPACYGRGGSEPTVTDADLALGHLDAGFFLGGEMRIDPELSRAALAGLAARRGVAAERAAARTQKNSKGRRTIRKL